MAYRNLGKKITPNKCTTEILKKDTKTILKMREKEL